MSVSGSQSYKKVVQLALRVEKLFGERISKEIFRREKVLDLYMVNFQRRVKVSNLLGIHLDLGLIQLVLFKLFDHRGLPDWACHHRVLPSKVEQ